MNLLIVMITYNRLAYTKKTLKSLMDTVTVPYELIVVDNHSTDGTVKWLKDNPQIDRVILNKQNYYPGKAANIGWAAGLKEATGITHLMRLDNDMELLPGWDTKAEEYFNEIPNLGQLGLDWGPVAQEPAAQEVWLVRGGLMAVTRWPGNVGGTNIIKKELWDKGLRYDETFWPDAPNPTIQEDCKMSIAVQELGYQFGHSTDHIANTIDKVTDYPEYTRKTFTERNYKVPEEIEEVND